MIQPPISKVVLRPDETGFSFASGITEQYKVKQMESGLFVPVMGTEYATDIAVQTATIVSVCTKAQERIGQEEYEWHEVILKPGDKVIAHHAMRDNHLKIHPDHPDLRSAYYHHVYAIILDEGYRMNCHWNFIEPLVIEKPERMENGVVVPAQKAKSTSYGTIKYLSESAKRNGLKEGDKVGIAPNSDYELKHRGIYYYRVHTENIICKLESFDSIG
jgi:co-chaperonin GroES (HSP10)